MKLVKKTLVVRAAAVALLAGLPLLTLAADQTVPGAGNAASTALAQHSPLVRSAMAFLTAQAQQIKDVALRNATIDILTNPHTCALHRIGLASAEARDAIVQQLLDAGLINATDAANFPGGATTGVFPPVLQASSFCPQLPQPYYAAPGSGFGEHHSYPGGLAVHSSNNDTSDVNLEAQYQAVYGQSGANGLPHVGDEDERHGPFQGDLKISHDVILAAPIWHDWAKSIVFQWNADGTEFAEFNFGGNGSTDAWGAAGDSRTGGHHILSIAESMARGLSPLMVITQASAHAAPTLGNEYKVVNWLRAAAIVARIDPVKAGYLVLDSANRLRLPPLGKLGDVDLNAAGQTNLRIEYTMHNLSDADFTFSIPAVSDVAVLLAQLAPEFGYDPAATALYNTHYRNPALSNLSAERLLVLYSAKGLPAVRAQLQTLRQRGVI
jgi:hypothetical protein